MMLDTFHLLRPWWLLALLPLALLVWRLAALRSGDAAWRRVMDARFLRRLMPEAGGRPRRWPLALLAAGWLAGSLALAGPAWERLPQPAFREQTPLVLALAMTPSMQAPDLAPDRLARARFELRDMLALRDEGRTGLLIYADEPFTVAPLTDDARVIDAQVPVLKADLMPGRGDRPDRAIAEAVALLKQAGAPGGGIVLLADGAGTQPQAAIDAAAAARGAGYPVSVLAMLPPEAEVPQALGDLAAAGGGALVRTAPGDSDIATLLAPHAANRPGAGQAELTDRQADAWLDEGIWLLLLPLLLAPLAFRRGGVAVLPPAGLAAALLLAQPGPAAAGTGSDPGIWADLWARADQQGAMALEAGDPAAAARLFADPAWQATAQYRAGAYEAAAAALAGEAGATAAYNRGNALAQAARIEEAIAAYDAALAAMPGHADAQHNRDLLQDLLDRQQEQQQDRQQSDGQQANQHQADQEQSGQESSDQQQSGQQQSGQEQSGQESSGHESSGQESSGQEQSAQEQSGQEQSGQEQSGQEQAGQEQSGQAQSGQEQAAQEQAGQEQAGQEQAGQEQGEAQAAAEAQEGEALGDRIDRAMEALLRPGDDAAEPGTAVQVDLPGRMTEQDQAAEQWLARVKDDPGALLREKLRRKYLENRYGSR
ncbi:MAG: VWA domain-containing protein [Sneathiellaceae bacterium]